MSALATTHLLFLGIWAGIVLAETVLEFAARTEVELRFTARLHYWIDLLVELPVLGGILLSGALLAAAAWPLDTLLWVKIGCALVPIGANLWCVVLVVQRHRAAGDASVLQGHSTRIRRLWVAVPFGVAALVLGLLRM